ncbi:hypothetical protein DL765_008721 [Monosporascus sp. GIB2]|nr:hypothetical protein DL765_008721 [Monosporascus sp. GIB2]
MSLGVKSLWRAQTWSVCVKEVSPVRVPSLHDRREGLGCLRRWVSQSALARASRHDESRHTWRTATNDRQKGEGAQETAPPTVLKGAAYRRTVKRKSELRKLQVSSASVLVKPPTKHPSIHETQRSLRKHTKSLDKQRLQGLFRHAYEKPDDDWRSTLDFMLRHTPSAGEIFDFRIVIGKGAAQEARRTLSGFDNNIGQIERRNQSIIRFEEYFPGDDTLVLSLSGSETAVRDSLRDIVKACGQITAVRILDEDWKERLGNVWMGTGLEQPLASLPSNEEDCSNDKTMTVLNESASELAALVQPRRYEHYTLTKRVDEITPPAEWTKHTFEKYIAALVYGHVPTGLARQLYGDGPSHQETVVSLLLDSFKSEHTRSAVSVSALKMALRYINSRGPGFRPAAREIFSQAESLNLAVDTETFGIFLAGASRAADMNNFNSILKLMVRKRFYLQSHTWYSFLEMIQDARIKRYIISRMEAKRLHRNPTFSTVIGQQLAPLDLERALQTSDSCDIGHFIDSQDVKYGRDWLNTTTLNKLLELMGRQNKLDVCHELLDLVHATHRTEPDSCTLNTMISHSRVIADHIALIQLMRSRWRVQPDSDTYSYLFAMAWRRRLPNMIRVLWQYALHYRLLSPKMRHRLTTLLRDDDDGNARNSGDQRVLLKTWEGVICGQQELEAARQHLDPGDPPAASHLVRAHLTRAAVAGGATKRPSVDLATKLREALDMDREIHRLLKEGRVVTPATRDALTVDIPMREVGNGNLDPASPLPLPVPERE